MTGILYIVSTPIGNLDDITLRALEVLKNSDYILAESSVRTSKLLKHYQISKKLITFNKDNEKRKISKIQKDLESGLIISLLSDAGTPAISDPGFEIIRRAQLFSVVPIPGPSSLTTALSISQIPINKFLFLGFLPKKLSERKKQLQYLQKYDVPLVIFESKHRINGLLSELMLLFGDNLKISIMRELTKIHEEVIHGNIKDIFSQISKKPLAGEITMIIAPNKSELVELSNFDKQIHELLKKYSVSEVVQIIRLFSGISKKELYKYVLNIRQEA